MSKRFIFNSTPLSGVYHIERKSIKDDRGFFSRFFCAEEFLEIGLKKSVAQINHTLTNTKGTIRGMHFQFPPYTETKIVSCIKGQVFDVALDIRKDSPTFLKWYSVVLNADRQNSIFIPDGFAHGFQTLTEDCELIYLHTSFFRADAEGGINVFDPFTDIKWPLKVTGISDRDMNHSFINQFKGI